MSAAAVRVYVDGPDVASEKAVLGILLRGEHGLQDIRGKLAPVDFGQPRHSKIFDAILGLAARGEAVELLKVDDELRRRGLRPDEYGSNDYLLELLELANTAVDAPYYAEQVAEGARRRRIQQGVRRVQEALEDGRPADEVVDLLAGVQGAAGPRQTRRTRRLDLDELMNAPPTPMLIAGLMPAVGVGFLVAEPNAGKSTLACDFAARIATGYAWQQRDVQHGHAVYIANEDPKGVGERLAVWREQNGMAVLRERVDVFTDKPPLDTPDGARELSETVDEQVGMGRKPSIIVIDTLAASLQASDSDPEISGPVMTMLGKLARRVSCCVLVVHHPTKPQPGMVKGWGSAFRGHGGWFGAADFCLNLEVATDGINLGVLKQRNAARGEPINLKLLKVDRADGSTGVVVTGRVSEPLQRHKDAIEAGADRVVEAVRRLGGRVQSKTAAVAAAGGNRSNNLAGWDLAMNQGRIKAAGTARSRMYVVVDGNAAGVCVSVPPTPPQYREPELDRSRLDGGAVLGTAPELVGTWNRPAPHQTVQPADPRGGVV
ncbi:MAG: AAA family ATPase [Opitutia bacterium]